MGLLQAMAEARYARFRERAYRKAEDEIGLLSENGHLGPITMAALIRWLDTWAPLRTGRERYGEWDWGELRQQYLMPKRFELAIWHGEDLCGLAIGTASDGNTLVSIRYLEGWPLVGHHFQGRVLQIIAVAVAAYGREIGAQKMRFVDPYEDLIPLYEEELGCHYVAPSGSLHGYCERVI